MRPSIVLCAMAACASFPHDQLLVRERASSPSRTSLAGTIVNVAGHRVEGATIVVDGIVASSGPDGRFRVDALPPGRWQLVIYYDDESHPFDVAVAAATQTTVAITIAAADPLTVQSSTPMIDMGTTMTGLTITSAPR